MLSTGTRIRALKSNAAVGYQQMQNCSLQDVWRGVNYGVGLRRGFDCPTNRQQFLYVSHTAHSRGAGFHGGYGYDTTTVC